MDGKQKLFLVILGMVLVVAAVLYGLNIMNPGEISPDDVTVNERTTEEEIQKPENIEKEYVNVFFIGKNENNEEVYRAVKRVYNENVDGSKVKYAITSLVLGPKPAEKSSGIYTEIPANTQILGITEKPDKVIINLSSAFATGGGTESVYKRLFQLIKTAKRNTEKAVFLYIEGQQADVIGGDGIMITQPLSENSLD